MFIKELKCKKGKTNNNILIIIVFNHCISTIIYIFISASEGSSCGTMLENVSICGQTVGWIT